MPTYPMPDLVVLLPGIMGSVLKKHGKTLWGFAPGAIARTLLTAGDSIADGLRLAGDDPTQGLLDDGVTAESLLPDLHLIPGFWKIDGYGVVTDALRTAFDIREGENFFTFPYDWRRDNRAAAHRLLHQTHDWLRTWRQRSPEAKLILVAHSMGGLVARYFLEVLGGWHDTKALITFGTPYRGSLNALDTLSNGIRKGPFYLGNLSDFCRSCTSLYQLLPIYPVYTADGGPLTRVGESANIPRVDARQASNALAFHREIMQAVDSNLRDPAYQRGRYRLFPIAGHTQSTLQSARLDQGKVVLENQYEGKNLGGDGTVPRVSAVPHEFNDAGNCTFAAARHGSLQNTRSLLDHLEGVITSLYLNLGKFLEPDRRLSLALDLQDLSFSDESIAIGVDAGEDRLDLRAQIKDAVTGTALASVPLSDHRDGTYTADCGKLPEGSYRVEVSGEARVAPIADAFGVAARAGQTG